NADLYPLKGPNVAKAKALANGHTGDGTLVYYTCNTGSCPLRAQIVQYDLRQIGVTLDIRPFARAVQFGKEGNKGEPFDIADEGWIADYADPYDFINVLLSGETIHDINNMKNAAPWAPRSDATNRYVVSSHFGNWTYNNVYGVDFAAITRK